MFALCGALEHASRHACITQCSCMLMRSSPQEQSCFLCKPGTSVGFSANQKECIWSLGEVLYFIFLSIQSSLFEIVFYLDMSAEYELITVFL